MKNRYIWPIFGVLVGWILSYVSIAIVLKQLGEFVDTSGIVLNPLFVWERPIGPIILGLASFLIGLSRDKLIVKQQDTEKKNIDLHKTMIEQAGRLSAELNSVMAELNGYTYQLDSIIETIDEGLCLVNRDFVIEEGFNNSFIKIFGDKEYLGNSIFNTAFSILNENMKKETMDFLELCFTNKTASPSMLNEANPIKEFEFVQVIEGIVVQKIISSSINIIKNANKEIEKIMFVFNDITSANELKKELEKRDKEYSKRYSIMVALFGNDKNVIKRFIDGLEEDMEILSKKIKELKQNENNSNIISDILGTVHSIKGEAFALGFEKLSGIAGEVETFFKKIKGEVLGLESNLEIIGFYEKLNNEKKEFDKTISALEDFLADDEVEDINTDISSSNLNLTDSVSKHLGYENISFDLLRKELEIINKSSAEEGGKQSVFTLNTSVKSIDSKKYKLIKELFLHLLRNSIAHGIELPLDRLEANKDVNGQITLDILKVDNNLIFEYTDDGTGFDVEKIKQRAIEHDIATEDEISKMSNRDIIKIVFNDGFSTTETVDMISGAGVGMSVVKKNIYKELKGKFTLTNRPGRGIKIRITIPV